MYENVYNTAMRLLSIVHAYTIFAHASLLCVLNTQSLQKTLFTFTQRHFLISLASTRKVKL